MPTPDLDAVRQRWKNATPGLFRGDASRHSHFEGPYAIIKPGTASENVVWCKFNTYFDHGADAELFVNAEADIGALLAEVDRLRAVVSRLPVTADGAPIVPGMTVWIADSTLAATVEAVGPNEVSAVDVMGAVRAPPPAMYYSTREALARAAGR